MRTVDTIIIHCAATPDGRPNTIRDVDAWHRQFGWMRSWKHRQSWQSHLTSVGYHYFIRVDGVAEPGRHLNEIGAHAGGHNSTSIGICLAGTSRFTTHQWDTLRDLVEDLQHQFPGSRVIGHRDLPDVKKSCPGFSVADWLSADMEPLAGHVLSTG